MNDRQVVYVGIDVSKDSLSVDAGALFKGDVPNTPAGIRSLVRKIRKRAGDGGVPLVERVEEMLPFFLRDPHTRIRHLEKRGPFPFFFMGSPPGGNCDMSSRRGKFHGIADEIDQNLLHAQGISVAIDG